MPRASGTFEGSKPHSVISIQQIWARVSSSIATFDTMLIVMLSSLVLYSIGISFSSKRNSNALDVDLTSAQRRGHFTALMQTLEQTVGNDDNSPCQQKNETCSMG